MDPKIDLYRDLRFVNFAGADLSFAMLAGTNLHGVNLTGANGREAIRIEGGVVEVLRNNVIVLAEGVVV